jgi:spermidine synthase
MYTELPEIKIFSKRGIVMKPLSLRVMGLLLFIGILLNNWGQCFVATADTKKVLYEKESLYHRVIVEEENQIRYLRFDTEAIQSAASVKDPSELVLRYTSYAHLSFLFQPDPRQILVIGLGGGTLPRKWRQDYPQAYIDAVEIDPDVIKVAKEFFFFQEDDRLRAIAQDGRIFVKRTRSRYDLIFVDAYIGSRIPFHLTTQEFLQEMKKRLTKKGIITFNLIGALTGPDSDLFRSLVKTLQSVFSQVYIFPVGGVSSFNEQQIRNIILIAMSEERRWTRVELLQQAEKLEKAQVIRAPVSQLVSTYYEKEISLNGVPLLTDDYAPVEILQIPR